MVKKGDKGHPMVNLAIGFVALLLLITISMGIIEQNTITGAAVAPADPATTAVSFMGLITIVSIIGLTLVSSLSLKIIINKKKK